MCPATFWTCVSCILRMPNRTESLNIRVTEDTRQEWKAWADDPTVPEATVAGIIRQAMDHYHTTVIDAETTSPGDTGVSHDQLQALVDQLDTTGGGEVEVDLDPITSRLDQVLDRLDDLDTRMDDISSAHNVSRDGLINLAEKLYRMLAYKENPEEDMPSLASAVRIDDAYGRAVLAATPKHIADYIGMDASAVENALEILEEDHRVGHIKDSGYRRYYRTDEEPQIHTLNDEDVVEYEDRHDHADTDRDGDGTGGI